MIETEGTQLSDVICRIVTDAALVLRGYNYKIVVCLRVYAFVYEMMSRLIAKGIIRRYSMRQRQGCIAATVKPPVGIVSKCGVCC